MIKLAQASQITGKARTTLLRAIHSGKLSVTRNEHGNYLIDVAELGRVYALKNEMSTSEPKAHRAQPDSDALLRTQLELLQMQLERERQTVDDLRKRLDGSEAERRQLLQVLTHQSTVGVDGEDRQVGLFKRWFK